MAQSNYRRISPWCHDNYDINESKKYSSTLSLPIMWIDGVELT